MGDATRSALPVTADIDTVAQHEAGHAVMRRLMGWPATRLTARTLLGRPHPTPEAVKRALRSEFAWVCDLLWPYDDVVYEIAERLADAGELSARTVTALCRRVRP
jgi:hypothetical protein